MGLIDYPLRLADFILKRVLSSKKIPIQRPNKLLICNGGHLGDVVLTTALLPAIREAFPDIRIGMLVGSWALPVLEKHPLINQIHCFDHWKLDREKKRNYFKSRKRALKEIKSHQYDTAIDCRFHFPNSAPLLWQAGIPTRIGFTSAGLSPFLTHALPWDPLENRSAVYAFFSLLQFFSEVRSDRLAPTLPLAQKKSPPPYWVVHIGAGDKQKEWPLEKWMALTEKLLKDGRRLIFTGKGERERRQIALIEKQFKIENQCDALDWSAFVTMIQNAQLLIGVDSSAGHVAAATGTPAVLIFTGIHPSELWRPFHPLIKIVNKKIDCSPCLTGCHSRSCILDIPVEQVYVKVKKVINLFTVVN